MKINKTNQTGAVSLFVVIFTCLMVTIVTVGFVNVMIKNQQQVTDTDLSKSAHDSAMAGVEDAKRLLLEHTACEAGGSTPPSGPTCSQKENAITDENCDTIQNGLGLGDSNEVLIQRDESTADEAEALDQAYTCVKINYNTPDYLNKLENGETDMIALRGESNFNRVKISWFKQSAGGPAITLPSVPAPLLPQQSAWAVTSPPVLRTQVIQTGDPFRQADFDDMSDGLLGLGVRSNTNTLFLYPATTAGVTRFINADNRDTDATKAPVTAACSTSPASGEYACSATLELVSPIGGGSRENVFLRLGAIYNATDYKIELLQGSNHIDFAGVQPEVDSTGRANALFRRVKARVEFTDSTFPYPQAAVELEGDLCKNFSVTNNRVIPTNPCSW